MITFILWNVSFLYWFTVIVTWKRRFFGCLLLRRGFIIWNIFHQNFWLSWLIDMMKQLILMRSDLIYLWSKFIWYVDISFSWIGSCMLFINFLMLINFINSSFFFNIHLLSLDNSSCLSNILWSIHTVLLISKIIKPLFLVFVNSFRSAWEKVFRTPWLTWWRLIHILFSQSFVIVVLWFLSFTSRIQGLKNRKIIS